MSPIDKIILLTTILTIIAFILKGDIWYIDSTNEIESK